VTVELEEYACDLYPMRFRLALIVLFVHFVLLIPFAEQEIQLELMVCALARIASAAHRSDRRRVLVVSSCVAPPVWNLGGGLHRRYCAEGLSSRLPRM
jgi:hypothetical protein